MNTIIERDQQRKNKRRISILITAQTLWHLKKEADKAGYSEIGRVIDELVKERVKGQ